jgi:hypothetical protein
MMKDEVWKKKKVYKNTTELWEAIMAAYSNWNLSYSLWVNSSTSCEGYGRKRWEDFILNKSFYPWIQFVLQQSGHFQKIGRKKESAKLSYFYHKFGQKQILPISVLLPWCQVDFL